MKLYYDAGCPVCNSFVKLLRKNLNGQIEFSEMPLGEQAQDFKLETERGNFLHGKNAIDYLAKEIPQIKDFFWMLPDSYKEKALHGTYAMGKFWRRFFYFLKGKRCSEC